MDVTHKGIIALLRSGLTGEKLILPEEFSLENGFDILKRQSVVPLSYQGAVNCNVPKDHPVMEKMLMICYRNLMAHERQMNAANQIFDAFEAHGIPYMPVKGCNMKSLYPKPEMRAMGDVDILIHPEDHSRIWSVMESLGFTFRIENDHVFEWHSDALHVELHKYLVPPNNEDYFAYYKTGWHLARKGQGSRYDLSVEDAYLFVFTHFARHYRVGGIGCRHLVDLYVYRSAFPNMDNSYLEGELKKLRLEEFHENVLRTLGVWFRGRDGDEVTNLITAFLFSGGNWGSIETGVYSEEVKRIRRTGKLKCSRIKATIRTFFPPISQLSYRYELVRKCPVLLPLVWVIRWFRILLLSPWKIPRKLKILKTVDDSGVASREQALLAVGLDFYFDGNS